MTGPADVAIPLIMLACVLALVFFAIDSQRVAASNRRNLHAWMLEEIGILASSTFTPSNPNHYRFYCWQQKIQGARWKGPQGWVKP